MHAMRQAGELVAAMALIAIDNPMCPGTGHRICNDCMKACIFQKQEPVNIPQVETRVLTETLALPVGPRDLPASHALEPAQRRTARTCGRTTGKNVLVVGPRPGRATRSRTTWRARASASSAVDGLKIEPLDVAARRDARRSRPRPVKTGERRSTASSHERRLLGFGGVSEYGITVRWDKNFLTIVYLTLARNRHVQASTAACASAGRSRSRTRGRSASTTSRSRRARAARRSST